VTPAEPAVVVGDDTIRLELLHVGAAVRRLEVRLPDGTWRNVVLGHPDFADYRGNHGYLGASVGRFANRIGGARFVLDGREYRTDANEPPNTLHGGEHGFGVIDWTLAGSGDGWAEFTLLSPDGDQGFPGELTARVRFEAADSTVRITYSATADASTIVNLTTHPYFNLDGEGSGTVERHALQVHASAWTPTRDDGIPTGEIRDVTGTAADFRSPRPLGPARTRAQAEGITRTDGYDHNFVVDGDGMREHCRVVGTSGLTLVLSSDQPGLQVYDGEHFVGEPGTSGLPYPRLAGLALEPQRFPDAPNQPGFPSSVLRPGEFYRASTTWQFFTDGGSSRL
jgi:aldose 1-epimerase